MNEVRHTRNVITFVGMITLNLSFQFMCKYIDIITVLSYFSCSALWMSMVHGIYKPQIEAAEKEKE
jgi:hypothetical protein